MRNINWGSWKTTAGGIAGALVAFGAIGKILNDMLLGNPVQFHELLIALGALGTAINGICGRDNNVTSKQLGISK